MRKSYIQFLIIIICLVSVYIVYNSFFISKSFVEEEIKDSISNEKGMTNLDPKTNSIKKNEVNLISNLKYKSFDTMGNEYLINSKSAEVSSNNEELIKLIDVSAKIILKNKSPIYINSDYAIHNKNEFDTKFYENVYIVHDDLKIFSENLDLMYNSNFVSLYNIKEIYNKNIKLKADKIDFDMLTKDVSINMYKNDQKVKIIYK
tara:strand:+ start:658 stop:1269 length:612 start_codon:yes stop_codon:yes gene_type:complete